jgi:hypothetical protein
MILKKRRISEGALGFQGVCVDTKIIPELIGELATAVF